MENTLQTRVLRGNRWKTQGKHECCVGTDGKQIKAHVLHGNLWKTTENTSVTLEPNENAWKTLGLRDNL